jgi:hypothetical protein
MVNWKKVRVAQDESHVSVGGLLEQTILEKPWELCMNRSRDTLAKEQCTGKVVEECSGVNAQKVESS